jgi:hypothetical protein
VPSRSARRVLRTLGFPVVLAIVPACQADYSATQPRSVPSPKISSGPLQFRGMTIREEMLQLNTAVPGLGGVFIDSQGRLTAAVVDSSRALRANVRGVVAEFATLHGSGDQARAGVRLVSSDVTYAQLDTLAQRIFLGDRSKRQSLWAVGVDEQNGYVAVRLESQEDAESMRAELTPREARFVRFFVEPRAVSGQLLRSFRRPLENAFRIVANGDAMQGGCSLGWMAYRYDFDPNQPDPSLGNYLVTASHCGLLMGTPDSGAVYQPGSAGLPQTEYVGSEFADAQRFVGAGIPSPSCFSANAVTCTCPLGEACVEADAMLIKLDNSVRESLHRSCSMNAHSGARQI